MFVSTAASFDTGSSLQTAAYCTSISHAMLCAKGKAVSYWPTVQHHLLMIEIARVQDQYAVLTNCLV